jgi:hypothetical protein
MKQARRDQLMPKGIQLNCSTTLDWGVFFIGFVTIIPIFIITASTAFLVAVILIVIIVAAVTITASSIVVLVASAIIRVAAIVIIIIVGGEVLLRITWKISMHPRVGLILHFLPGFHF